MNRIEILTLTGSLVSVLRWHRLFPASAGMNRQLLWQIEMICRILYVIHENQKNIEKIAAGKNMRYAIGDIHGGSCTFKALLDRLSLRHGDELFLMGDYVDRGPDSRGVLDIILNLMKCGYYSVHPLRGNHDEMLLRTILNDHDMFSAMYFDEWGKYALKSFGLSNPGDVPMKYRTLLESMPYIIVEADFIFVHAGLSMNVDDPVHDSDVIDMLWSRNSTVDIRKLGGRQLVTGHSIETLQAIRESLCTGHICLDNGAFTRRQPEMGNLVALNLDTKELIVQPWCDGAANM